MSTPISPRRCHKIFGRASLQTSILGFIAASVALRQGVGLRALRWQVWVLAQGLQSDGGLCCGEKLWFRLQVKRFPRWFKLIPRPPLRCAGCPSLVWHIKPPTLTFDFWLLRKVLHDDLGQTPNYSWKRKSVLVVVMWESASRKCVVLYKCQV